MAGPAEEGEAAEEAAPADASAPSSPAAVDPLLDELRQELGEALLEVAEGSALGELTILVRREEIARVGAILRSRFRYTQLVDLCGADHPHRSPRFEVIYHLYSFRENRRIRIKVSTAEDLPVPSVTGLWRGAAWPEREAHDLFGIVFSGHPGLDPLLLWEGFAGHPLRKDFPLAGIDTGAALHAPQRPESPENLKTPEFTSEQA